MVFPVRNVPFRSVPGNTEGHNQIAKNLNVDPSTVYRTVKLFDETGTVCSIQGFHKTTTKKLSIQDELAIFGMVLDDPSVY